MDKSLSAELEIRKPGSQLPQAFFNGKHLGVSVITDLTCPCVCLLQQRSAVHADAAYLCHFTHMNPLACSHFHSALSLPPPPPHTHTPTYLPCVPTH
jgi:hypothetical protein